MLRRMRERSSASEGFTLIELLIVVIILGILAAIVVFNVAGARDDARVRACQANASQILKAIESYYVNTGSYPGTTDTALRAALVPTYLKSMPGIGTIRSGYDYSFTVSISGNTVTVTGSATGTSATVASATYVSGGASGQNTVTVNSTSGVAVGQSVSGTGIPAGTTVSAISGSTLTLSQTATSQIAGTLTFSTTATCVAGG